MSDIKVICTSDKNVSITFTWDEFTPFHLVDIEGIYGIEANVVTSENTTTDGSTYQGATAKERNIVLGGAGEGAMSKHRYEVISRHITAIGSTLNGIIEAVKAGTWKPDK